jgi:hypothetical protein
MAGNMGMCRPRRIQKKAARVIARLKAVLREETPKKGCNIKLNPYCIAVYILRQRRLQEEYALNCEVLYYITMYNKKAHISVRCGKMPENKGFVCLRIVHMSVDWSI